MITKENLLYSAFFRLDGEFLSAISLWFWGWHKTHQEHQTIHLNKAIDVEDLAYPNCH